MKIALSGGIGCGKSSALEIFKAKNFPTFSADEAAHEILSTKEAEDFVKKNFGNDALENGKISRKKLAEIVFGNYKARQTLEDFLHPKIQNSWQKFCAENEKNGRVPVVEIPLLFEKKFDKEFDISICVSASKKTRLKRLKIRGVPADEALKRISAQLPLEDKIARANFLLTNDGSLDFLSAQIERLIEKNFFL